MSHFDQTALEYERIHNKNLGVLGESSDFFVQHKVELVAELWREASLPKNGFFLDLGCGIGRTYSVLREKLPELHYSGVDPSAESIRIAKSQAGNPDFQVFDGQKLPFPDNHFHAVFAACVIHHVPRVQREQLFREVHRILKPGGYAMVFEHNPFNPLTQFLVKTCDFDDDAILLRANELKQLLKSASFEKPIADYVLFLPQFLRKRLPKIEKYLNWCPIGAQYWVRAQK